MKRLFSVPEFGVGMVLVVLMLMFQALNPLFLSPLNIAGMLRATAYTGLVGAGMALCLISGTIDISVGATAGLASVVFSKLLVAGLPLVGSALAAVVVGLLAGSINSVTIVYFRVSPFIATISAMYILRGLANFASDGFSVYPLPPIVEKLGAQQPLGLSWALLVTICVLIVVAILLRATVWGLCLRAVGSDKESAECTEVPVKRIQSSALVITGGLAALSGVLVTGILGSGQAAVGTGWELNAIAACAIGGVSLFGYEGSMVGLFLGMMVIQVINNGIIMAGVSPELQTVVIGLILVGFVTVDVRRRLWMNIEQF
jgi:ribose transport system permease protein